MNAFFEALARASVFGLVALFVALCAQWLLGKRVPAAWRAWIWRVALLQSVFALLPLAPIQWQVLAPPRAAITVAPPIEIEGADEFPISENSIALPDVPSQTQTWDEPIAIAPPTAVVTPHAPFDWRAFALAIYALGLAFRLAQLAGGALKLRRVLNACVPIEDAVLTARLDQVRAKLALKRAPQLLQCEDGSPFLVGIRRPRIVLPRALCDAGNAQLDAVLAHELAHQKRRDLVWSALLWLVQTLLWFHPLSWAARRFHGLETECACDELALQIAPIAPQSYGALLLNSMKNFTFHSPLAAGTCDGLFAFKTRLLRLEHTPAKPRKTAKLAFVAALALSCIALVPLKLVARAGDTALVTPTKPNVAGNVVLQGVVTSKQTGQPLAGVPVTFIPILPRDAASNELFTINGDGEFRRNWAKDMRPDLPNKQETVTDSRGYFRFNAGGRHHLILVDSKISVLPSKYTEFSARQAVVTEMGTMPKRDYQFELDEASRRSPKFALKTILGSAVVQGVVTSKQTGKPLAGVPMILIPNPAQGKPTNKMSFAARWKPMSVVVWPTKPTNKVNFNPDIRARQETVTDGRGYFRFNATGGEFHLLSDGQISVDPSNIITIRAETIAVFTVKEGQKQEYNFALDKTSKKPDKASIATPLPKTRGTGNAVVQGTILSKQTRKPLAGVPVILLAGNARLTPKKQALATISAHQETITDARGYFRFNATGGVHSLLLGGKISLDADKVSDFSARQIYVVPLKDASMRNYGFELDETRFDAAMPPDNTTLASASGQVVDENKRPLAGATITLYQNLGQGSSPVKSVKSDSNGRFSFQGLRPNSRISISSSLSGYGATRSRIIENGNNRVYALSMPRAKASLRGVVIGEDGQPARGFQVQTSGSVPTVKTDAQGRFFLPQIEPGATGVRVSTPNGGNGWGPIKVRGGDQNVRIRLTHSISDARFPVIASGPATSVNSSDRTRSLIGKTAPEIQAMNWANNKTTSLASLRGKVVLLAFQDFTSGDRQELSRFAHDFVATARVVGIQIYTPRDYTPRDMGEVPGAGVNAASTRLTFPIAIDAPRGDGNGIGGYTLSAYGFGITGIYGYAVIGRDGKVIYAGDKLNRAIQFASR